jgi:hypothetical protein
MRKEVAFGIAAGVLVIVALTLGYQQLGGRTRQRDLRADAARVNDMRAIAAEIQWKTRPQDADRKLPTKLEDLKEQLEASHVRTKDPITGTPYEYTPKTGSTYELCAVFAADSEEQEGIGGQRNWVHPKGRHCFSLDASMSPPPGVPQIPY